MFMLAGDWDICRRSVSYFAEAARNHARQVPATKAGLQDHGCRQTEAATSPDECGVCHGLGIVPWDM